MGTYKRLPRGKAKPHDEFRDWATHALLWVKNNWQITLELLAVGAIAFAIVIGANSYWHHRSGMAASALFSAMRETPGSDEQIKRLEELAGKYTRTPAGKQAMMALGSLYINRKDYDQATGVFKKLAGISRNHAMLEVASMHRLAEAELLKGNAQAAAESYLKVASDPNNLIGLQSRLRAASAFEKAGDMPRAQELYRQVIHDAGETNDSVWQNAEERLLWLILQNKIQG